MKWTYKIILIFFFQLIFVSSITILPDSQKDYDRYFDNDINDTKERYKHIISALATVKYTDEYYGLFYKRRLRCGRITNLNGVTTEAGVPKTGGTFKDINNNFKNIDETNLKGLYKKCCVIDGQQFNALAIHHYSDKNNEEVEFTAIIRMSNTDENEEMSVSVNACTGIDIQGGCTGYVVLDNSIKIPPNSIYKYEFSWNPGKKLYSINGGPFTGNYEVKPDFHPYFLVSNPNGLFPELCIHSVVLMVDLKTYFRAIIGNQYNFCSQSGCYNSLCNGKTCYEKYLTFTYWKWYTDCTALGCVENNFCDSSGYCKDCDSQCRTCFSSSMNDCKSCHRNSVFPQFKKNDEFQQGQQCTYEFSNFALFRDFEVEIPIPLTHRFTFEFWVYIQDSTKLYDRNLKSSFSSFIIKDFGAISIAKNPDTETSLDVYVIPNEMYFPLTQDVISYDAFKEMIAQQNFQYTKGTLTNVSSKWVYIRGGISYNHMEMFALQGNNKNIDYLPLYSDHKDVKKTYNYGSIFRKFYREGDKAILRCQGFSFTTTSIYIRNLNIYDEYIQSPVNYPNYFNMHTLTSILDYPQLMISIPFNDIIINTASQIAQYTMYDFSGQFTNKDGSKNKVLSSPQTLSYIRGEIMPPRNFRRLKFIDAGNSEYDSTDLSSLKPLTCDAPRHYCDKPDVPYVCKANNLLLSAGNTIQCNPTCERNQKSYMRYPMAKKNQETLEKITNGQCTKECDADVTVCPKNAGDTLSSFNCGNNKLPLFYQCYESKTDQLKEDSALQFSGTLNTKSFMIPFPNEETDYMVEMWFHIDLHRQLYTPVKNSHMFIGANSQKKDSHEIYFDVDSGQFKVRVMKEQMIGGSLGVKTNDFSLGQDIYHYGWNHFIFQSETTEVSQNSFTTKISVALTNSFVDVATVDGKIGINKICFCNKDQDCCGKSGVFWLDLFIKEIKLWDINYATINTIINYDKYTKYDATLIAIKSRFSLTVDNLNNNKIVDTKNPANKASFIIDDSLFNPDEDQKFNYGWNFNWNDLETSKCISKATVNGGIVTVSGAEDCDIGCEQCYGGGSKYMCFKCKQGFALIGSTCTQTRYGKPTYFINFPVGGADYDIKIQSLDKVAVPSVTIFFYLKLYTFRDVTANNKDSIPIILFDTDFGIYYNANKKSLFLKKGANVQFEYEGFRKHFGEWVPVSLSAFRETHTGVQLQKNMAAMTVNFTPLHYLPFQQTTPATDFEEYLFPKFTISRHMVGHVSDVAIYNIFIVNAFGYAQHKNSANSGLTNSIIQSFNHYTDDKKTCENGQGIECVEDYLSFIDQEGPCNDEQLVSVQRQDFPPTCTNNPSKCEAIEQTLIKMDNCDYLYATCDNKTPHSINNLIFSYTKVNTNNKYISCGKANTLDFSRFPTGKIEGLESPKETFKLEFWFLSQSYININFGSLTVTWSDHMIIKVSHSNNKFIAECRSFNGVKSLQFEYDNTSENRWRYVVCGIDIPNGGFYLTNLQQQHMEKDTPGNAPAIGATSTLSFQEDSPRNFGVTYVSEMRLWSCYNCASDRAFIPYNKDDNLFSDVIHYFPFKSPSGEVKDEKPNSTIQPVTLTESTDFKGYGVLEPIPDIPDCNESGSLYFSLKTGTGCDTIFNFNIFKEDVVFTQIPSSPTNKYTMDFWFFIESPDDFSKGINLIYDKHMTISLIAEDVKQDKLSVYCFPQEYRDNLFGTQGKKDIEKKYQASQNKEKDEINNGFSTWQYVRCAYSYDLQEFYLNDKQPTAIKPEIYDNKGSKNAFSFKKFVNLYTKLIVNGAKDNFTRIFIQNINIFRDYIPRTLDLKHLLMKLYITKGMSSAYTILSFSVDLQNDYDIVTNRLKYYITDYDFVTSNTLYLDNFKTKVISRDYSTYPTYDRLELCTVGKRFNSATGQCEYITSPNNCDDNSVFCSDTDKFFWCKKGEYLNVDTQQCGSKCPADYTRPSDIFDGYGMCYIKKDKMNYDTIPVEDGDLAQGKYEDKFTCANGFLLVNYHCVSNSLDENSAIYFSTKYGFHNMIANYAQLGLKNYYVDFWFMFETTHGKKMKDQPADEEYYSIFIAYPHFISRKEDKIYYHNSFIPLQYYEIENISPLNWNRVVIDFNEIRGASIGDTKQFIKVYINNDFSNPAIDLTVSKSNDFALAQIAFCHKENSPYSSCNLGLNSASYKIYEPIWDDAYYRDIVVWNRDTTNIASIESFGSDINKDFTMNIVSYHTMKLSSIKKNTIQSKGYYKGEKIDITLRSATERLYDKSSNVNWVTSFDETKPDKYITEVTSLYTSQPYFSLDSTSYTVGNCGGNCLRCFGKKDEQDQNVEVEGACITCKQTFVLSGGKCVKTTGEYLRMPENEDIEFKYDLTNGGGRKEITIMFFMKFLGTTGGKTGKSPIIYFNNKDSYFGWDNDNDCFTIIYDQDKVAYKYKNSRVSIGKWALYSISIFHTENTNQGVFPNMIQLMIDTITVELDKDFKKIAAVTPIPFNKLTISKEVSALFFDLRVYSKFYVGGYALGQMPTPTGNTLLKRYTLNKKGECVKKDDITNQNSFADACVSDDNPYDDDSLKCSSTEGDFRVIDSTTRTKECKKCSSYCYESQCFTEDETGCLCTHDSTKFLLRENDGKYYCEKPSSLNLNEFNNIELSGIDLGTSSYMMEVWIFIQTYISPDNFKGLAISWEGFTKVEVNPKANDALIDLVCYAKSDDTTLKAETQIKPDEWVFVRCIVDKSLKTLTLNSQETKFTKTLATVTGTTKLILKDKSTQPYGISLVRELRLWNTKNNLFYDTSHMNLATDNTYENLIHYYKNFYEPTAANPNRNFILDSKKNTKTTLTSLNPPYPYSYVNEKLTTLVLCDSGYTYKLNAITLKYECSIYSSGDIIDDIEDDKTVYTPTDLLAKMKVLLETATNGYTKPSTVTSPVSGVKLGSDNSIKLEDPVVSNAYCSNKGYAKIVDRELACYCFSDYVGKYCQLQSTDYSNIGKIFEHYADKLDETYMEYISNGGDDEDKILTSIKYFIEGIDNFQTDNTMLKVMTDWLNDKVVYNVNECKVAYIEIVDKLYTCFVTLINKYKIGVMSNSAGTSRNAELNKMQKEELQSFAGILKGFYEYLTSLCFASLKPSIGKNHFNFLSSNLNVDCIKLSSSQSINATKFFIDNLKKEENYLPYFNIDSCKSDLYAKGILNAQFITWFNSPYYYDSDLIWNYTSHYITVKLYDDDVNPLTSTDCDKDKAVQFFLPVFNPEMVKVVNDNYFHFNIDNMFSSTHHIFTEPKYIEKNGKISNETREERIEKYYFEYLMEFGYLDAKEMTLTDKGVKYINATEKKYFICSSTHLTDFLLNYEFNPYPTKVDGRLYFIKHFNLFLYGGNYKSNYGLILFCIIFGVYALNLTVCNIKVYLEKKKVNKRYKLIEKFLIAHVYPYGNNEGEYVIKKGRKIYNVESDELGEKLDDKNLETEKKNEDQKLNGLNEIQPDFMTINDVRDKEKYFQQFNQMAEDVLNPETEEVKYVNQATATKENETKVILKKHEAKLDKEKPKSRRRSTMVDAYNNNFVIEKSKTNSHLKSSYNPERTLDDEDDDIEKDGSGSKGKAIHNLQIYNEDMRIKQLIQLKISPCKFFSFNIRRWLFISTFNANVTYGPMTKALYLPMYLSINVFINTMFYLYMDENVSKDNVFKESKYLIKFILITLFSIILSNAYFYVKSTVVAIGKNKYREMLFAFKTSKKKFDDMYIRALKRIRIFTYIETVVFVGFTITAFIFSFGLSAVYPKQGELMIISFGCVIGADILVEMFVEFLIMLLYCCRKNQLFVVILDNFNRAKSYKSISP